MLARRVLLVLGVVMVIAGLWLAYITLNQAPVPQNQAAPEPDRPALLMAVRQIPAGTLLRDGDIGWQEIEPGQSRPGHLLQSDVAKSDYLGAITRRAFVEGEPLMANELVKPSDRDFLSAVLRPGRRAVSISVDASQSASGLVLPGDYVDVILTQNFGDNLAGAARRSVGETVLKNVRVVAVDRSLGSQTKPGGEAKITPGEVRLPKTITLELDEEQAQRLFVAMQLGRLQLAVRPLEGSGAARVAQENGARPTWAADVSRALQEMADAPAPDAGSGSRIERSVRRAPSATSLRR